LQALHEYGRGIIGTYHLLLAHDVAESPNLYRHALPKDSFVIMDNSIIELGYPVSPDVMHQALNVVHSDVIVLPDVIRDKQQTIELACEYANTYEAYLVQGQKFMAVPQGRTLEELQECAWELNQLPGVAFWGVGRFVTQMLGTRKDFLNWLYITMRKDETVHERFIHLLGFSDNLYDDIECCKKLGVMGIDSAAPVREGQLGKLMSRHPREAHSPRGKTWWEDVSNEIKAETIANLSLIRHWINE
jgi:queuine/archaeosine tRNA-ribosyltransferase